ncbi:gamma carbonic anhydrase family protein, partial [Pseudomonadota bacterium]
LHPHASIWFNCVARGDNEPITIGENSNVQDGCILHTDPGFPLNIGKRVTVGHKVMLHGCSIDEGSLVGMNCVILNGVKIGRDCLIGANTLLTQGKEIPDRSLVMGSPGKIIRELNDDEVSEIRETAMRYVANSKRYREQLKQDNEQ